MYISYIIAICRNNDFNVSSTFQASFIFQSMKIDMLSRMIPFFDFSVVEKISVDAVKHNFVAIKVNHLSGAVHFGTVVCGPDSVHYLFTVASWL